MRIVIVEDEIKIREGMAKLIESETEHTVVEKAADGEEGLKAILRFKPDLVITDIRMSKMDGLEMIRELKQRQISARVVILSGYSEFEYAKKAIQYGVDDYLLKPLSAEDVTELLEKVRVQIEKEELAKDTLEVYLSNLIHCAENEQERIYQILNQICGFPYKGRYDLLLGYVGTAENTYKKHVEDSVEELRGKYPDFKIYYTYVNHLQKAYILIQGEKDTQSFEKIEGSFYRRLLLQFQNNAEKAMWTKEEFYDLTELKGIMSKLDLRIAHAFQADCKNWIGENADEKYDVLDVPNNIINKIKNGICQENSQRLNEGSKELIQYLKSGKFKAEDVKLFFVKNYFMMLEHLQEINRPVYEHLIKSNYQKFYEQAITWSEMERVYRDIIENITNTNVNREDISNYVIQKAIAYIREHFHEGLTQEEIARKLEITPEYLSTLFKRELGINFSTFLKKFRISHAKRLLKGTDMKIYEIASAVGYSDSKYFQRVFKEQIGISPGEYRAMN